MINRNTPSPNPPKETYVDTMFRGRVYRICSTGQMNYLMLLYASTIMQEAAQKGVQISEEEVKKKTEEWKLNSEYIDIDTLFSMMTPKEKETWRNAYRFGGVHRAFPKE